MIFVGDIAPGVLFSYLMTRYSPVFITLAGLTLPLFTALYEWLLFDHTVTWHFWISMGIIALGLYLFARDMQRNAVVVP
jgi:drug/metabolite transporter (DMT)-like permease